MLNIFHRLNYCDRGVFFKCFGKVMRRKILANVNNVAQEESFATNSLVCFVNTISNLILKNRKSKLSKVKGEFLNPELIQFNENDSI